MDLVDYSEEVFNQIKSDYTNFANEALTLEEITAIPISALKGDNIVESSENTPWYDGQSVMEYLETVEVAASSQSRPFRMPVQWVNRPNREFRGFAGLMEAVVFLPEIKSEFYQAVQNQPLQGL